MGDVLFSFQNMLSFGHAFLDTVINVFAFVVFAEHVIIRLAFTIDIRVKYYILPYLRNSYTSKSSIMILTRDLNGSCANKFGCLHF